MTVSHAMRLSTLAVLATATTALHSKQTFFSPGVYKDASMTSFCFPKAERATTHKSIFTNVKPIVLEIADWQSHKIVTRMAEILIREWLGLQVVRHPGSNRLPPLACR